MKTFIIALTSGALSFVFALVVAQGFFHDTTAERDAWQQQVDEHALDRQTVNSMIDSAYRLGSTAEKERIQVCLLPDQYAPSFEGPWCSQPYYRNLVKAVGR